MGEVAERPSEDQPDHKKSARRLFLKLTKCPDFPEARKLLEDGVTPWAVAEWLQSKGQYADVKVASLARQLARFRDLVLSDNPLLASKSFIDRKVAHFDLKKFDDIEELTKLVIVQKERIARDLKLEEKLPKLLRDLRAEIMALVDMIERRARLMMELGMRAKAPDVHVVEDRTFGQMLELLSEPDRLKVRRKIQGMYRHELVVGVEEVSETGGVRSGGQGDEDEGGDPKVLVAGGENAHPVAPDAQF